MSKPKLIPLSLNGISGTLTITENNTYDVRNIASVIVDVPTSGGGGGEGGDDDDPIGDEMTVDVITWSAFQAVDKSTVVGHIYSIEL